MGSIIIYSTAGSDAEAEKLASGLVDVRLAACVQLMPIKSIYRWKGGVERAAETLMIIKTRKKFSGKVIGWLKEHHAYEVPEAVAVDIAEGLPEYLQWIENETRGYREDLQDG